MSRTRTFLTRWQWMAVALSLLISLLVGACGEPPAAPTEPSTPTEIAAAPSTPTSAPTEPPPTDPPTAPPATATPPPTDTPMPTATPTQEPVDDTACIACHTSQETLQAVADAEEEPESLSEGEG
jgi:hypothetical protein